MMQINATVGVNKHSGNSKLPSCPMKSQLLLWPCFNQQTVQILDGSSHMQLELQIQLIDFESGDTYS